MSEHDRVFQGRRFSLSGGVDAYELKDGPTLVASFPLGDEGWARAWGRFMELEPGGPIFDPARCSVRGNFKLRRLKGTVRRASAWRGAGTVSVSPYGLRIEGRHTMTGGKKALIFLVGVAIWIALTVFENTLLPDGYASASILPLIFLWFLLEYMLLVRADVTYPWASVRKVVVDIKKGHIAFEVDDSRQRNPAVFEGDWRGLVSALRHNGVAVEPEAKIDQVLSIAGGGK